MRLPRSVSVYPLLLFRFICGSCRMKGKHAINNTQNFLTIQPIIRHLSLFRTHRVGLL
jgi:hypothetical protein